jgi:hypothetical protein
VLFGLASVFTAAHRCGWRWDRGDREPHVIEHENADPASRSAPGSAGERRLTQPPELPADSSPAARHPRRKRS